METVGLKLSLAVLFVLQVLLYEGSFHFWSYPSWIAQSWLLTNLMNFRLNYFPFFYLFIFMLGGVIARHYEGFKALITGKKALLTAFCCQRRIQYLDVLPLDRSLRHALRKHHQPLCSS